MTNKVVVNINNVESINKYLSVFTAIENDLVTLTISNPNSFEIKVHVLMDRIISRFGSSSLPLTDCKKGTPTNESLNKLSLATQKSKSLLWDYLISPNDFITLRNLQLEPNDMIFVSINSTDENTQARVEVASQIDRRNETSIDTILNNIGSSIDKLGTNVSYTTDKLTASIETITKSITDITNVLKQINEKLQ